MQEKARDAFLLDYERLCRRHGLWVASYADGPVMVALRSLADDAYVEFGLNTKDEALAEHLKALRANQ